MSEDFKQTFRIVGFTITELTKFRYLMDMMGYDDVQKFVSDFIAERLVYPRQKAIDYHERELLSLKSTGKPLREPRPFTEGEWPFQ